MADFKVIAFGGSRFSSSRKFINSLGFAENQVQHKFGDDNVLGQLYVSAKAFVYPSIYEDLEFPLEAMFIIAL